MIDVDTLNEILRIIEEEIQKYAPGSPESIALWRLKERLSQ